MVVTRRTAGALAGWGVFVVVASAFAAGMVALGFGPLPSTLIGGVVGGFGGVGARYGVDRHWPAGIADDADRGGIDAVLAVCRADRDPAVWADMRPIGPDPDATAALPAVKGYQGRRRAGVR